MPCYGPATILGTFSSFLRERKSKVGADVGTGRKFGALTTILIQDEVFEARSTCGIEIKKPRTNQKPNRKTIARSL